jgi:predicted acyltransferase
MNPRYYSLDVFRGATVALMILVNNPGSWGHIYAPLKHAPWHGLTPTDLVFPFFLFAVGNALAFVLPRLQEAGAAVFWRKVTKRTLLIFAIGLFLNWWPFARWEGDQLQALGWTWTNANGDPGGVRILGVLQRIALCYFFAAVIAFYTRPRVTFLISALLLLLYWALCIAGNPADPYSLAGWFGTGIDKAVLHPVHMYHGEGVAFDPEGLVSTLPAITQVLFGFLAGAYIRERAKAQTAEPGGALYQTLTGLFIAAVGLLVAGYCWSLSFPVNKKIWTSSYVVVTTGLALAVLATLIYAIEVKGTRNRITRFFDVFGKNALFVFALSAFLPKGLRLLRLPDGVDAAGAPLYLSPWNWLYEKVYRFMPGAPELGSLLFALTVILFMWAICYWLDRKRIYIKV